MKTQGLFRAQDTLVDHPFRKTPANIDSRTPGSQSAPLVAGAAQTLYHCLGETLLLFLIRKVDVRLRDRSAVVEFGALIDVARLPERVKAVGER